ncbi:MAG TPA: hypothetical protein VLY04_19240 [Bryobacteraceae bacterium]|nr:hypothetical protein [Bryobacteraceae bacterium]
MADGEIQISNEAGEPTAVIVPIEPWREIESERETAYLLKSETMKRRLLAAKERQDELSLEAVVEKLRIDPEPFKDLHPQNTNAVTVGPPRRLVRGGDIEFQRI